MPKPDAPPLTRAVVLRGVGFALAIGLGGVAVWLIVTSTTQKRIEIGVLAGLWGLLLGAYSMFGRRSLHYADVGAVAPAPGREVELRSTATELERADEAAARRAFEAHLEHMLRREIQTSVAREVAQLRAEIAELRSELVEKVTGQVRLERIETTRLIGSDLEALQHEVRQLKTARESAAFADIPVARHEPPRSLSARVTEPARVRPAKSEPVPEPARPSRPLSESPSVLTTAPMRPVPRSVEPPPVPVVAPAAPAPAPEKEPDGTTRPAPGPAPSDDPFATLPRITPFPFELDPIEPAETGPTNGSAYAGRRRRTDADEEPAGRHSVARRDRPAEDADAGHDLLARLLERETAR